MGKVFTITEGLENLGALKTGGQGSVYKGRRIGEIITAVKLLPTPLADDDPNNKNYIDFQNEVEKLKRVNEEPNVNVVKILNAGVTDTGCFPFIEMEFIEGPDLGELLKPPHDRIFTIAETVRVASHLACALAHCHKVGVKHGDIKSNNVKFNQVTGSYVLLDFGLAIMSDEQRRTSLRQAGAIEFMAPEQNEGEMLFESDVYSFGIVIYELLAGQVPFPLKDGGETARNQVRLAHMEQPIPDVMTLRKENLPGTWSDEQKQRELQVPRWLLQVVTKCLEKDPSSRFANGVALSDQIVLKSALSNVADDGRLPVATADDNDLLSENSRLQSLLNEREKEVEQLRQYPADRRNIPDNTRVSRKAFYALLVFTLVLGSLAVYGLFFNNNTTATLAQNTMVTDSVTNQDSIDQALANLTVKENRKKKTEKQDPDTSSSLIDVSDHTAVNDTTTASPNELPPAEITRYKVRSKAFIHSEANESSKTSEFIFQWGDLQLTPLEERNGFIYVSFTNPVGQAYKGWIRKADLVRVGK